MLKFNISRKKMLVVLVAFGICSTVIGVMVTTVTKVQAKDVKVAAIEQKVQGTEKALEDTHKALDEANKEVQNRDKEIQDASKTVGDLQSKTQSLQSELDKLKEQNAQLQQDKEALTQQRDSLASQAQDLTKKIQLQSFKVGRSYGQVQTLSYSGSRTPIETVKVLATAYGSDCEGCSGITYTGVDVRSETPHIIAVDPTVIPLHSVVELVAGGNSLGIFYAEDVGRDIKGNRVDVLYPNEEASKSFGVKDCEVRILSKPSLY